MISFISSKNNFTMKTCFEIYLRIVYRFLFIKIFILVFLKKNYHINKNYVIWEWVFSNWTIQQIV